MLKMSFGTFKGIDDLCLYMILPNFLLAIGSSGDGFQRLSILRLGLASEICVHSFVLVCKCS